MSDVIKRDNNYLAELVVIAVLALEVMVVEIVVEEILAAWFVAVIMVDRP